MRIVLLAGMVAIALGMAGCDAFTGGDDDGSGTVTITGRVVDSISGDAVEGAFVRVNATNLVEETDASGSFSLSLDIDSTSTIQLLITRTGYVGTSRNVLAVADRTIEVEAIEIQPEADGGGGIPSESGRPSNILLVSQSATAIGVREGGSQEVAEFVFQVADSLGQPISLAEAIELQFSLGASPGGAAFIYPQSALTNNRGRVTTNVSAGTVAGVVQLVATATVDGRTIRSLPVALAIHGGLPDIEHFGVGPALFNMARAWSTFGITNEITAFVGDQYGNPVRPGTVVYFTTAGGIVEGSAETNELGSATVTLVSALPRPVHTEFGQGYARIVARTGDINQATIEVPTVVLFSGTSQIVIAGGQGALQVGGSYAFAVHDENQNPLAAGTTITVTAEGQNVEATGNTNVTLDDVLQGGRGITQFNFGLTATTNEDGEPLVATIESVKIQVGGPNGQAERIILASGQVLTRMDDGSLEIVGSIQ